MTTRKIVRRVLLTAALTSAPLLSLDQAAAYSSNGGAYRPGTRTSQHRSLKPVPAEEPVAAVEKSESGSIQQVQYQNGNSAAVAPANNQAVMNELNRLFQESGKEMPPMNAYSPQPVNPQQAVTPNQQRPIQQQQMPQQQTRSQSVAQSQPFAQQNAAAPVSSYRPHSYSPNTAVAVSPSARQPTPPASPQKKNLFQKFIGKFRGEPETKAAAVSSPQMANTSGLSTYSAPPPNARPIATTPQPATGASVAARPQATGSNGAVAGGQFRPAQSLQPSSQFVQQPQQRPVHQGASAVASPARPVQNAHQNQYQARAGQFSPGTPAAVSNGQPPARTQYVQPGTGPSFVQGYVAAPTPAVAGQQPNVKAVARSGKPVDNTPIEPAPVAPAADDFVDPFEEAVADSGADEILDLDSLIEIPGARANAQTQLPAEEVQTVDVQVAQVRTRTVVVGAEASSTTEHAATTADENPFTGVRLAVSDEEYFQEIASQNSKGTTVSAELKTEQLPPVEELTAELPGIEIGTLQDDDELEVANPLIIRDVAPEATRTDVQPVGEQSVATSTAPLKSVEDMRTRVTSEQARREEQRAQIARRSGQFGFKGFCPVQLRDHRELVDANSQIVGNFGLQEYTFSSMQAKAAFDADPSRYAPAAGGSDVVLLVNTGEEQPGMLDYSLWYRDRLYLFRSRETMAQFSQDPSRFANQY